VETVKRKKSKKSDGAEVEASTDAINVEDAVMDAEPITSASELKKFLLHVKDKMDDDSAAPLYAMSALNYVLSLPNVYDVLEAESREVAREIWLRLKKSGLQLRNPPLLFPDEGNGVVAN